MKHTAKHLLIPALALVCLGAALLTGWAMADKSLTSGQYLRANDGSHLVIDRRGEPIVMRDLSGRETMFDGLKSGDRVLVLHDGVAESYPARSGAYWCLRLGEGDPGDLPGHTLEQLTELGWLSAASF